MRNFTLLLLACGIGFAGGLSCTTRQAPSSSPQPPGDQAAAEAKAKKEKEAADAKAAKEAAEKARKEKAAQAAEQQAKARHDQEMAVAAAKAKQEKDAADARTAKKAQDEAARLAKTQKSSGSPPPSAKPTANTNTVPVPDANLNVPLTKEQKLSDLDRRYNNDEIDSRQYQVERAKIMAGP
jgi:regulator of protease activity HflC (stomatin/prohibitin superfamily)